MIHAMFDWMSGYWLSLFVKAGEALVDVNGATISVGSTVKFVGKVIAINQDPHYGTIQVQGNNPNGNPIMFMPGSGSPISLNYPTPNPQTPNKIYAFEPLQLVVGS